MKIGIDVSQSVYRTGVGDYTKSLVTQLLKLDREDEFILYGGSLRRKGEFARLFPPTTNSVLKTSILSPTLADIFWNKLHTLPIEKFTGKLDIFHSSDWAQPPSKAYKITTIHDLAPLRLPHFTPKKIVDVHFNRLKWVKKEVDKIIAVSSFTKQEAVGLLKINPDKIIVIPEAGDENIQKASFDVLERTLKKYKIVGEYLLVVGTNPRKNISRIIDAFLSLEKSRDLQLVITGKKPNDAPHNSKVVYAGFVNTEEISALYTGAAALVYASLYEGFGQPILEAFKIGCPVVTSNVSSMPEVAGDAAVLVDPNETYSIKGGIERVLANRERWVKKGLERAEEFSWTDTAKLTLRVYKEALL